MEVLAVINAAGGVMGGVQSVLGGVNHLFGRVDDVKSKTRWLEITVVNMSPAQVLRIDDNWFDVGRFWNQPFGGIQPGSAQTMYVCNSDGTHFCGVSGGIGMTVTDKEGSKFTEGGNTQWVCTFSNPYMGASKCLTRWKDFGIKPLWDQMSEARITYDQRCGCHFKDNNHIVFVWKDPANNW